MKSLIEMHYANKQADETGKAAGDLIAAMLKLFPFFVFGVSGLVRVQAGMTVKTASVR